MWATVDRLPPIGLPWRAIIKVRTIQPLQVTGTTVCHRRTFRGFLHSLFECDPYRAEMHDLCAPGPNSASKTDLVQPRHGPIIPRIRKKGPVLVLLNWRSTSRWGVVHAKPTKRQLTPHLPSKPHKWAL